MTLSTSVDKVASAIERASSGLVNRRALVELIVLSAIAGEHLLVIGPPGTAKSLAVRRISQQFGGRYFEYLLGKFTEPSELFGPVDLRRLKEGVFETRTEGMLPEAEIAFLDEVFRGSSAILNTLLGILNERSFRRGTTVQRCPLRVCVGASNELPEDEALAAFADRFLVQVYADAVEDRMLEELLEAGWRSDAQGPTLPAASLADLDALAAAVTQVDMSGVLGPLADAIRTLRNLDLPLSDRRIVRAQRLVAASAVLAGRSLADGRDLWPFVYVVSGREEQARAREALREHLAAAANPTLPYAAEDAAAGAAARAARLVAEASALLAQLDAADGADPRTLHLRLEALGREIDAGFPPGELPEDLAEMRARLRSRVESYRSTAAASGA